MVAESAIVSSLLLVYVTSSRVHDALAIWAIESFKFNAGTFPVSKSVIYLAGDQPLALAMRVRGELPVRRELPVQLGRGVVLTLE